MNKVWLVFIMVVTSFICHGQNDSIAQKERSNYNIVTPQVLTPEKIGVSRYDLFDSNQIWLSIIVLGFGIICLLIEFFLFKTLNASPQYSFRFFIVTIVIISGLFLITAGFDNDHIAPIVGLLGTIVGYLLGNSSKSETTNNV